MIIKLAVSLLGLHSPEHQDDVLVKTNFKLTMSLSYDLYTFSTGTKIKRAFTSNILLNSLSVSKIVKLVLQLTILKRPPFPFAPLRRG